MLLNKLMGSNIIEIPQFGQCPIVTTYVQKC